MNKTQEALKLALEALLSCSAGDYSTSHVIHPSFDVDAVNKAIEAIDALAEQQAQPKLSDYEPDGMRHNKPQKRPQNCGTGYCSCIECLYEQPAQQQPVAYDKTELNCFAQDLYDKKMREGKRGHYESMFHVIHQCIKKVAPPTSKPWVGLSTDEIYDMYNEPRSDAEMVEFARAIEAKLKEKNT